MLPIKPDQTNITNTNNQNNQNINTAGKFSICSCFDEVCKGVTGFFSSFSITEKKPQITILSNVILPFPAPFLEDILYRIFAVASPHTYSQLALTSVDMYKMSKDKTLSTKFDEEFIALTKDFANNELGSITIRSFKKKAAELNKLFIGKFSDMQIKCALRKALLEKHGDKEFYKLSSACGNAVFRGNPEKFVQGLDDFYIELARNPEGNARYNTMETILKLESLT